MTRALIYRFPSLRKTAQPPAMQIPPPPPPPRWLLFIIGATYNIYLLLLYIVATALLQHKISTL